MDTAGSSRASVVVKHSWCEDERQEVEAKLLNRCRGDFGTPNHHYSFCPTDTQGNPMSTARFLPAKDEDKELETFHWAITPSSQVPSLPLHRYLWFHVGKSIGQSLVHAKTPWELCLAIGHGMIGMCQSLLQVSQCLT